MWSERPRIVATDWDRPYTEENHGTLVMPQPALDTDKANKILDAAAKCREPIRHQSGLVQREMILLLTGHHSALILSGAINQQNPYRINPQAVRHTPQFDRYQWRLQV